MLLKWLWENTAAPLVYDVITGQLLHCWSLIKTKLSSGGYRLSRPLQLTRARGDKQICLFFWCHLPHTILWSAKQGWSPRCWAVTECYRKFRCVLQTHTMRHTGCAWPRSVTGTLPGGHITMDGSACQPLSPGSNAYRPVYFHCWRAKGCDCLSAHSYLLNQQTTVLHSHEALPFWQ